MTTDGGFAVEELGRAGDWHPRWCRHRHDGQPHQSVRFHVAGRQVWATADDHWHTRIHRAGAGRMDGDAARYLAAVVEYLTEPAGTVG